MLFIEEEKDFAGKDALKAVAKRLSSISVNKYYNPYKDFSWPESLPLDVYWTSPELLSLFGTEHYAALDQRQIYALSRWEAINLYSLSTFGERELIAVLLQYIHGDDCHEVSEYLHHFIEEEGKHMWLFSQFCLRYGGKIYDPKTIALSAQTFEDESISAFVAFARILIFEEIGDFFNVKNKSDADIPEFIRFLSQVHHEDEARHLAMGKDILVFLHKRLRKSHSRRDIDVIENYLKKFMITSMEMFYSPAVYADVGLREPYRIRASLLKDPIRMGFHRTVLGRVHRFMLDSEIFSNEAL